jgi:glycine/D-amino acid oxidase-like deaminating enzyme
VGLRAVTPDAKPLLGQTPVHGFLLAAGFGGFGIQLGAVAGEMLAALILGPQMPAELKPWSLDRFAQGAWHCRGGG